MVAKAEITGGMGTGAPAHAPHEVATGAPTPTREQLDLARSHELELAPFAPTPLNDQQMAGLLGKSVAEIRVLQTAGPRAPLPVEAPPTPIPGTTEAPLPPPPGTLLDADGRPIVSSKKGADVPLRKPPRGLVQPKTGKTVMPSVVDTPVDSIPEHDTTYAPDVSVDNREEGAPPAVPAADTAARDSSTEPVQLGQGASTLRETAAAVLARPAATEDQPYRPAQSDTESPARGLPTAVADPGKQITGGFGDVGEAQYFPLDGTEVGAAVVRLLETMIDRVRDDLRFSIAVTYPRVHVRVVVEVDGFVRDQSFQIPVVWVDKATTKTPVAVARAHGQEIVFCLVNQIQEMTDTGESLAPPNAIRQELDLPIPQKRWIVASSGSKQLVDVVPDALPQPR